MMQLTRETRAGLEALLALENFPEDVFCELNNLGTLDVQAPTQEAVKRVRAALPSFHFWKKSAPDKYSPWWNYDATNTNPDAPIRAVHIYACYEAPPMCRAIEEHVRVRQQVPVAFEERDVMETRVRWECEPDRDEP